MAERLRSPQKCPNWLKKAALVSSLVGTTFLGSVFGKSDASAQVVPQASSRVYLPAVMRPLEGPISNVRAWIEWPGDHMADSYYDPIWTCKTSGIKYPLVLVGRQMNLITPDNIIFNSSTDGRMGMQFGSEHVGYPWTINCILTISDEANLALYNIATGFNFRVFERGAQNGLSGSSYVATDLVTIPQSVEQAR